MQLNVYLNELNSIKKLIDTGTSKFESSLSTLDNYLQQLKCASNSDLFNENGRTLWSNSNLDVDEIKSKYFFKLNQSVNQSIEIIEDLL